MDLTDTPEQATFRRATRRWLSEHRHLAPATVTAADGDEQAVADAHRAWQRELAVAGLAGVTWPVEHGGRGLGPVEQAIILQELAAAGVPGIFDTIAIDIFGPAIIDVGTTAQRDRHLGPMLHGDEVWCQLYSEPGAGSDLAAVATRATRREDGGWTLRGQKVWTTNAQFASFGLALARTDPEVSKHHGLTMFIVPMDAPGVTIRGLRQISGEAEFNEVFLDDVEIAADATLGPVGGGWGVALQTLVNERLSLGLGGEAQHYRADRFVAAVRRDADAAASPRIRHRIGEIAIDLMALEMAGLQTLSDIAAGRPPGVEVGLGKITMVNAATAAAELIAGFSGPDALAEPDSEWAYLTSFLPGLRSAGGTEEILRNTVGERVLGLPAEPRVDKGVPYSQLRAGSAAPVHEGSAR